jgi:hypothetical protein
MDGDAVNEMAWAKGAPRGKNLMPWEIEDEVERLGGIYALGGLCRSFPIRDGNLVTGQHHYSCIETTELIVGRSGSDAARRVLPGERIGTRSSRRSIG